MLSLTALSSLIPAVKILTAGIAILGAVLFGYRILSKIKQNAVDFYKISEQSAQIKKQKEILDTSAKIDMNVNKMSDPESELKKNWNRDNA